MKHRAFAMVALCGLVVRFAHGWVPLPEWTWRDGPVPIALGLAATAPVGSDGDWHGAAQEAVTLWNAKLDRIQLAAAPAEGEVWYDNGRNELFFSREIFGEPFPHGVLAVTRVTRERRVAVESDVVFNAGEQWAVYRGTAQGAVRDLRRVALHELGHLLGLDHPDESGQSVAAAMNANNAGLEALTADDEGGARALYGLGVGAPPVIVAQPGDIEVLQGTVARFVVGAGGRGPLSYEWRRNGTIVLTGTSATLRFTAGLGDAASYSVVVRSPAGAVTSREARLTVRPAQMPEVSLLTAPLTVVAGTEVALRAALLKGDEPLRYAWHRDGEAIPGAETPELIIKEAQLADAGSYTFSATNAAGMATSGAVRVTIMPPTPPRFFSDLAAKLVEPGETVRLSIPNEASPPVRFQWHKNGSPLPGATGATLTIASFSAGDAGRYSLSLANPFGEVTSNQAEMIWARGSRVAFARQPANVTQYAASTVWLSAEVELTNVTYRWFKDGQPLSLGAGGRISGAGTKQLSIAGLVASDAGEYFVEATESGGTARSAVARLEVRPLPPPVILRQPATNTLAVGQQASLSVTARLRPVDPGGEPLAGVGLAYQWLKDGSAVAGATASILTFAATTAGAGRYRVRISSSGGTTMSDEAEVVVDGGGSGFTVHPQSMTFERNASSLRAASVDAEITLRRAARVYPVYFYSRVGESTPVSPWDDTERWPQAYTLTLGAPNALSVSRPFTLSFLPQSRPTITQHPAGVATQLERGFLLRVSADQDHGVTYQWYRNGAPVRFSGVPEQVGGTFAPELAGAYTVAVTNAAGTVVSAPAIVSERTTLESIIHLQPLGVTVAQDQPVTLSVGVRPGASPLQWQRNGAFIVGATSSQYRFTASAATAGDYAVTVGSGEASEMSRTAKVVVLAARRPPENIVGPYSVSVPAGADAVLSVAASGVPLPDRFQWLRNFVPIPGATASRLILRNVVQEDFNLYSVDVTNDVGTIRSGTARVSLDRSGRLVNLATRAAVGRGGEVLIAGFSIAGTEPRTVLVRGIGDQLSEFSVAGVLRDPQLRLFDARGAQIAANDDWFRNNEGTIAALRSASARVGAFAQREDARDAALLATLPAGNYTAQVSGVVNTTGVALLEIYELGASANNRLVNLSSRAQVGRGASVLIPGIVIRGTEPRRLLVRAVGPGLSDFGVSGALSDPVMTIFRFGATIARNDNWEQATNAADIAQATAKIGAFALRSGSKDAALLVDLPPDAYTVQVAGVQDATGIALVEVYEIRP